MTEVSVLNLIPRFSGESEKDAIDRATELVSIVESLGYIRYWVSEHHNFKGIISSATEIIIQHLLQHSTSIRVGAGGVMLPNHSPLQVAERYGTLEVLYPNRVDVGLGRAPGTDPYTARLIYRGDTSNEGFSSGIRDLLRYFGSPEEQDIVAAYPGMDTHIPLYILGSSVNSAYVAAEFGLPYSFAAHFAKQDTAEALAIYRDRFKPSVYLDEPYVILGVLGCAAEDDKEARRLYTAAQSQLLHAARGKKGYSPKPDKNLFDKITSAEKLLIDTKMGLGLIGDAASVDDTYQQLMADYQPDELIIVSYLPKIEQLETSYRIIKQVVDNHQ